MTGDWKSAENKTPLRILLLGAVFGLALALQPQQALASHISEQQAIDAFQALRGRVDDLEAENSGQQQQIDDLSALVYSLFPDPLTVFISSQAYAPVIDFGSLADADGICQQLATDAGLSGTYKAWLSDEFESPSSRFSQSAAPYVLTDGTLVAAGWSDLTDCTNPNCLHHTIDLDQNQAPAAGDYAWTGTTQSGEVDLAEGTCLGWTSSDGGGAAGRVESLGGWTSVLYGRYCGLSLHLYCFGQ